MSLSSRDEVAATVRTGTAICVMVFNVVADLLATTQHLGIWAEKEVIRDHGNPPPRSCLTDTLLDVSHLTLYNQAPPSAAPTIFH